MKINKFGEIAIKAAEFLQKSPIDNPKNAWKKAEDAHCNGKSYSGKDCPQCAFVGLCEYGLVKGVPASEYANSKDDKANKHYAIEAVFLLAKNQKSFANASELWRNVVSKLNLESKKHNGQMDVVIGLWEKDYIVRPMN